MLNSGFPKAKIISKDLGFVDLHKTCAQQRARLCRCLKLSTGHTEQLSSSLKVARLVKALKLVQKTTLNSPVTQNWHQNIVSNCCSACATVPLLKIRNKSQCATVFCKESGSATINVPKLGCQ